MDMYAAVTARFPDFLLILLRMASLLLSGPVFSSRFIPAQWKIAISLLLSLLVLPVVPGLAAMPADVVNWAALAVREVVFGLTAGFVASLSLAAIQVAGELLDFQIGFGMVNVLDPQSGVQVPLLGSFYQVLAMLVFLLTNGHHLWLAATVDSFHRVPLGTFALPDSLQPYVLHLFAQAFVLGVKLALPVLATLFLVEIGLSLMARTVPQMNLFVIGLPAKIAIGLVALSLAIPAAAALIGNLFEQMIFDVGGLYRIVGP